MSAIPSAIWRLLHLRAEDSRRSWLVAALGFSLILFWYRTRVTAPSAPIKDSGRSTSTVARPLEWLRRNIGTRRALIGSRGAVHGPTLRESFFSTVSTQRTSDAWIPRLRSSGWASAPTLE